MDMNILQPGDWRYYAAAAFVVLVMRVAWHALSFRAYCYLLLPSTFLHEAAHALVASLLGGKATISSLIPTDIGGGVYQLGSASYTELPGGAFARSLVSIAPIINWLPAAALGIFLQFPQPFWMGMALMFGFLLFAHAGLPSWSDMRRSGLVGWLLLLGVLLQVGVKALGHLGILAGLD